MYPSLPLSRTSSTNSSVHTLTYPLWSTHILPLTHTHTHTSSCSHTTYVSPTHITPHTSTHALTHLLTLTLHIFPHTQHTTHPHMHTHIHTSTASTQTLQMRTATWVTLWRRCRTFREPCSATQGPYRSTQPLQMHTATLPPSTKTRGTYQKPLRHIAWPSSWNLTSQMPSVTWLTACRWVAGVGVDRGGEGGVENIFHNDCPPAMDVGQMYQWKHLIFGASLHTSLSKVYPRVQFHGYMS